MNSDGDKQCYPTCPNLRTPLARNHGRTAGEPAPRCQSAASRRCRRLAPALGDLPRLLRSGISEDATGYTWDQVPRSSGSMFGRTAARNDVVECFAIRVVHEGSWSVRPTCYLEDLFVDPASRDSGVGRALFDDFVALGRERGWSSLPRHTRAGNAQARKLYDRYTPADDVVRYRLKVEPYGTHYKGTSIFSNQMLGFIRTSPTSFRV